MTTKVRVRHVFETPQTVGLAFAIAGVVAGYLKAREEDARRHAGHPAGARATR